MVYIHTTFHNNLNITGALSNEVLHFQKQCIVHVQTFTDNNPIVQYMLRYFHYVLSSIFC